MIENNEKIIEKILYLGIKIYCAYIESTDIKYKGRVFFKSGYYRGGGAKIFAKNLRGAKISAKIWGGVEIFLNFPEYALIFLCFLGGVCKFSVKI